MEIKALFIFEMMGRPPEHIKSALSELIDTLGEQKAIKIIRKEVHEPKPVEKEGVSDLFTTFAEVELIAENINIIFDITFSMLPSHVEILEPKELDLKNFDLSSIVSNLAVKIHKYDEIAKISIMEKNILIQRLKEAEEKINNLEDGVKSKKKEKKVVKKKKGKKKINIK
jgi:hypothetical protein